jgi:hypothetical protein
MRGIGRLRWEPRQQPVTKHLCLLLEGGHVLGRPARLGYRPRHGGALVLHTRPQRFQPVAQLGGRSAVVAVVAGDRVAQLRRQVVHLAAAFERQLHRLQLRAHGAQIDVACEVVVLLELLDRVALDARTDRLPDDRQEIDEVFGAQQRVERLCPRDVPAGELLERGWLVVIEVIDVCVRMACDDVADDVTDCLEGRLLFAIVECPPRAVPVGAPDTEQVLASSVAREPRAFEVEKQIASRRCGQAPQPDRTFARRFVVALQRQQLDYRRARGSLRVLHTRLMAEASVGVGRAARRLERHWHRHRGGGSQRRHAARGELNGDGGRCRR